MGEYAEMMLDGTCCQCCGEFLHEGDEGDGFPSFCATCAPDDDSDLRPLPRSVKSKKPPKRKIKCPLCERQISWTGLSDHITDAHYNKKEPAQ